MLLTAGATPTVQEEDDMTPAQAKQLADAIYLLDQKIGPAIGRLETALAGDRFEWLRAQIATEVTEALESVQTGGIDADAIADRIADRLRARLEA
jgi:hypothetical protein